MLLEFSDRILDPTLKQPCLAPRARGVWGGCSGVPVFRCSLLYYFYFAYLHKIKLTVTLILPKFKILNYLILAIKY